MTGQVENSSNSDIETWERAMHEVTPYNLYEPMAIYQRIKDLHTDTCPIRGPDPVFSVPCADPPCFWMEWSEMDGDCAPAKERSGDFLGTDEITRYKRLNTLRILWEEHWEQYMTWLMGYLDYTEGLCKRLSAHNAELHQHNSRDALGPLLDGVRAKAAKAFRWEGSWDEEMETVDSDHHLDYITAALAELLNRSPNHNSSTRSCVDPRLIAWALATPIHPHTQLPLPFDASTCTAYVTRLVNAAVAFDELALPVEGGQSPDVSATSSRLFGAVLIVCAAITVDLFHLYFWVFPDC
ncbi:hypothetical protein BOTBODRAFT_182803, partial [Botryobasidium botryosum FD-172 SS1]